MTPIDDLLAQLDLEPLDRDLFIVTPTLGEGRLFGGLVAAMSVIAAGRTVAQDDRHLHSLHSYFLRGGQHDVPIQFAVDRIRDGRSFTTRRVVALQGGAAIFNLSASFVRPEPGIEHQDTMPDVPGPEALPDWEELRTKRLGLPASSHGRPVEVRSCSEVEFDPEQTGPPTRHVWMRPRGDIPEDPLLHAAVLVYASDRTLLSTASRPHEKGWGSFLHASLDHSVWLHRPPRFDDWVLFATHSPVAHAARGLIHAAMYRRDGVCIASVTQEGLIRTPRQ